MKIKLEAIVNGIEMQTDESYVLLDLTSSEILFFTDEELSMAKSKDDISDNPQWMQNAVKSVRQYLENQDKYLELPTKYDFHEYHVMEKFILSLPHETQREELYHAIKGKGAFSNFKHALDRYSLDSEWYEYRDKAIEKLAIEWCKDNDLEFE